MKIVIDSIGSRKLSLNAILKKLDNLSNDPKHTKAQMTQELAVSPTDRN